MNTPSRMLIPAAVLLMSACSGEDAPEVRGLRWVEKADPGADAKRAIATKDFRLKAAYGFTTYIPGTQSSNFPVLKAMYGISVMDGTTDAPVNAEHSRLIELADKYAEVYNQAIFAARPFRSAK